MEIDQIQAIDNHAHPVCPVAQGEQPDKDYDACRWSNWSHPSIPSDCGLARWI
jgi:hypothetical protein